MIPYATLGNNIEKIQEIITSLEQEKGNWSKIIYTDSAIKNNVLNKIDEIISELKKFKADCEISGKRMELNAKSE